jgi:hypothetical protein
MATTAEFIGAYIAEIIITTAAITLIATTATITIIVACIMAITAIGETYRVIARQQTSTVQGKGRGTRCGLFPFAERSTAWCELSRTPDTLPRISFAGLRGLKVTRWKILLRRVDSYFAE